MSTSKLCIWTTSVETLSMPWFALQGTALPFGLWKAEWVRETQKPMSGSGTWVTSPFSMLIIFKLENQSGSEEKYACDVVTYR